LSPLGPRSVDYRFRWPQRWKQKSTPSHGAGVVARTLQVLSVWTDAWNVMTNVQPEPSVDHASETVAFYQAAFGATGLR
jgi:hypothetical protein